MTKRKCPDCNGSGHTKENDMPMNLAAFGSPVPVFKKKVTCRRCHGSGEIY